MMHSALFLPCEMNSVEMVFLLDYAWDHSLRGLIKRTIIRTIFVHFW
jgi:hypothetical protein